MAQISTILSHEVMPSHPANNPPAGYIWQYSLADGLYEKSSSGVIVKLGNIPGGGGGISNDDSIINAIIYG